MRGWVGRPGSPIGISNRQGGPRPMDLRITVVIATRDRLANLGTTLDRLKALPESPRIILVDNDSRDGTADFIRREHPEVGLITPGDNLGAAARTLGAREAGSPYV